MVNQPKSDCIYHFSISVDSVSVLHQNWGKITKISKILRKLLDSLEKNYDQRIPNTNQLKSINEFCDCNLITNRYMQ